VKRLALFILLILVVLAGLSLTDTQASRSLHAWLNRLADTVASGGSTASHESHKCRQGTSISYSTQKCPKGSVEEAMGGGTVTVVSMPTAAALPASAASLPTVRDLMAHPNEPTLYEKQIERATK
jgi:hypothetical protein